LVSGELGLSKESKHGPTFREYLIASGLRTEEQYAEFEQKIFAKVWNLPFTCGK
jgi:acyl-[acyl-carrier-protein] desaturase